MDIAVSLSLAIAGQSYKAWRDRRLLGEGTVYTLGRGSELIDVKLQADVKAQERMREQEILSQEPLSLSLASAPVASPVNVKLVPSGQERVRRALRRLGTGLEVSLSRPGSLVASGILSLALTALTGMGTAQASEIVLPSDTTRAVQCVLANNFTQSDPSAADSLLADISKPAKHRVFTRGAMIGASGTDNAYSTHSNTASPGYHTNSYGTYNITHQNAAPGQHMNQPAKDDQAHINQTATGHVNQTKYRVTGGDAKGHINTNKYGGIHMNGTADDNGKLEGSF